MKTPRNWRLQVASLITLAAIGLGFRQVMPNPSSPLFYSKAFSYSAPANATLQDRDNFFHDQAFGGSSPTTLSFEGRNGEVTGTLTGFVMEGTNERQLTLTVLDDAIDVLQARTYLNGQLIATATTANGGIVVRSGLALATMSLLIPPAGTYYTLEVQWDPSAGVTNSHKLSCDL